MPNTLGGRVAGGPSGPAAATNSRVSEREDLANFISMITRDETPFMSSLGKTKATAIYHEWQTDALAAPGNSRIPEGTDFQIPTVANTGLSGTTDIDPGTGTLNAGSAFINIGANRTRLGNYTQINGKTIAVSGTKRAIDQAGVADEYAYQLKKRGTEMRRDIEADLVNGWNVSGFSSNTAQTGTARTFGGYQSFVGASNVRIAAGATTSGTNNVALNTGFSANGTDRPVTVTGTLTDALRGSLALSDIDAVMQSIYEEGGKASKIMLSPKLRRDFSDLMVTDSGVRRNIDESGKLRQSVDVYMSDFGDLMVVPNYIMGLNTGNSLPNQADTSDFSALIYDPMWFSIATLRPMQEVEVGQRGDSTVGMFVEECTLEVKNPFGSGAIYGLA